MQKITLLPKGMLQLFISLTPSLLSIVFFSCSLKPPLCRPQSHRRRSVSSPFASVGCEEYPGLFVMAWAVCRVSPDKLMCQSDGALPLTRTPAICKDFELFLCPVAPELNAVQKRGRGGRKRRQGWESGGAQEKERFKLIIILLL